MCVTTIQLRECVFRAIDWYVSKDERTPLYAMTNGTVIDYIQKFYYGTQAVGVKNEDGSVLRYCEIDTALRVGDTVKKGQQIGTIKANTLDGDTMLHLELYRGTKSGSFS